MIVATYRLQFRNGFTFEDAASILPHLAQAGITHLYASPIFAATAGSTHGYDVTDHNVLDPALGGEAGFAVLAEALEAAGLGLIVDIVPNHMAASMENPWWRDVAMHGEASDYARHFDIDWNAGKLILPILGKPYGEAIVEGDITRRETPDGPVLAVYDNILPLAPGTEHIENLHDLHEAQNYRLTYWRFGRDGLTYRRFFEVTGLVGVRVEDPLVFEHVHRTILRLVAEGTVTGLRVDHVDGLSDPAGYLATLAERAAVPIWVEKILEADEGLRDWPVEGTTGYEFIAAMAALFTDGDGLQALSEAYGEIAQNDLPAMMDEAKTVILTRNLAGELERLTELALTLFRSDLSARDHGRATVREGLVALMKGLSVYRTYLPSDDAEDRAVLAAARDAATAEKLEDERVLDDLIELLTADPAAANDPDVAIEFVARLQQTSGPLMAKALEDTLFYRHHRLLALNEVGGALDPALGAGRFLGVAAAGGLAATQTHDTKRGEDSRARLYALSAPDAAARFVALWPTLPGDLPDKLKWALAQMLFAADPLGDDADFADRFREAALKSVREAMEDTSWTRRDADFERQVAEAAVAMAGARERLAPLADVERAGAVIGLGQALLKTLGRPVPDIYQGCFDWDFAMVDPDNRRPVDFEAEAALCAAARVADPAFLARDWTSGAVKARVLLEGLALRRERAALFARSSLTALALQGGAAGDFAAFERRSGDERLVALIPIRPLPYLGEAGLGLSRGSLADLTVADAAGLVDRLTGRALGEKGAIEAALRNFPILIATNR
ncbi:malto-oligosyltrehalose synthase [Acuticoccus sp. I52.16.1]|uniref:malto-oligosyltrehalose synthase n=1 Tax=Acuticoccus sp. I52.16.1 TaxID=2928472 RepID=UPI001FD30CB0|nr:malto-oligosyltrehalose synthase [Acuticoccus sp. I52.16.1]UOM36171.1 malto-oligosyltrehalose synthase [Acuticoccus sp. I52.16.1]